MLAGHCDQIGLIVQHIDDEGFIYVQPIGGWDPQMLIGQRMTVWTADGPVFGVIARKPIHLLTEEERKQVSKIKDLWLDIGAANKEEAVEGGPHRRRHDRRARLPRDAQQPGRLAGHGRQGRLLGRRRGPAAGEPKRQAHLRRCTRFRRCRRRSACAAPTPARSASIRRSAWRSTSVTPPIARRSKRRKRATCGSARAGDPSRTEHEPQGRRAARSGRRRQPDRLSVGRLGEATGTDANAMQISRAGVATGLISIPNRYMHSPVEMISLDDIDRAADLLARFAEQIEADAEFHAVALTTEQSWASRKTGRPTRQARGENPWFGCPRH